MAGNDSALMRLLEIMARLRHPEQGCPWDREQDYRSLLAYTLEEAYEVVQAVEGGDETELKGELGDLLFQVVFYSQIASEQGSFDFGDVAAAIGDKLVERHPHVFGGETLRTAAEQSAAWEAHKAREREDRSAPGDDRGALAGVALALPALTRAVKLQDRAARVGFDWRDPYRVIDKVEEELAEFREELDGAGTRQGLEHEIGDLLMAVSNLARHVDIDAEGALRRANQRFERRFRAMERIAAARGRPLAAFSLAEQEALWQEAKREVG